MIDLLQNLYPQHRKICQLYTYCVQNPLAEISMAKLQETFQLQNHTICQQEKYIHTIMDRQNGHGFIYGSEIGRYLQYVNQQCRDLYQKFEQIRELYNKYVNRDKQSMQSIYCIIDNTDKSLLYIGRTNDFKRRKQQHLSEIQKIEQFFKDDMKYVALASLIWQQHQIQFKQIAGYIAADSIQTAETDFIQNLNPLLNTKQVAKPPVDVQVAAHAIISLNCIDQFKYSNIKIQK